MLEIIIFQIFFNLVYFPFKLLGYSHIHMHAFASSVVRSHDISLKPLAYFPSFVSFVFSYQLPHQDPRSTFVILIFISRINTTCGC